MQVFWSFAYFYFKVQVLESTSLYQLSHSAHALPSYMHYHYHQTTTSNSKNLFHSPLSFPKRYSNPQRFSLEVIALPQCHRLVPRYIDETIEAKIIFIDYIYLNYIYIIDIYWAKYVLFFLPGFWAGEIGSRHELNFDAENLTIEQKIKRKKETRLDFTDLGDYDKSI